jgi:hypothetical protein
MPSLRGNFRWRDFTNLFGRNNAWPYLVIWGAVVAVVAAITFTVVAAIHVDNDNLEASENRAFMREFHAQDELTESDLDVEPAEARKILAFSILELNYIGDAGIALDDQQEQVFDEVASTGAMPEGLDVSRGTWDYWQQSMVLLLLLVYVYYAWIIFGVYAEETRRSRNFVADLPWRRVWPIALVVFTAGWPCYLVSAVRLRRFRARHPVTAGVTGANGQTSTDFVEFDDESSDTDQVIRIPEYRGYREDSQVARATYVSLRTTKWLRSFTERRQNAQSELEYTERDLRQLGERMRDAQSRLGTLRADVRRYEELETDAESAPELQHVETEYDRLLRLPGVAGIRVVNDDQLCLLVKVRSIYEGVLYDFGDWEIRFGPRSRHLGTRRLRSGVRGTWHGMEPPYNNGDGTFCFGARGQVIADNVLQGQYLEAVEIAINCMHSVNDGHEQFIPQAYQEARD